MTQDEQELVRKLVEQERERVVPQVLAPRERATLHWTELPEDTSQGTLSREWNHYRRIVGELIAERREGQWILIKGEEIIGIWTSEEECDRVRLERFPMQAVFMKQVCCREPVLRCGEYYRLGAADGSHPARRSDRRCARQSRRFSRGQAAC